MPSETGKISISRKITENTAASKALKSSSTTVRREIEPGEGVHSKHKEVSGTDNDLLSKIIKAVKKDRLTLASALGKAVSVKIQEDRIILLYDIKDRFSGEMVKKDREFITGKLKDSLNKSYGIDIVFNTESAERKAVNDERIKMLQRIFRGEIVKGE